VVGEEVDHPLSERRALPVAPSDVRTGQRLPGPDVVGQRLLERVGVLGEE
jgi:hypothetical protein